MSALYHKRSPDFSSTGALHTKGSSNLKKDGAESMMGKGINCLFLLTFFYCINLLMNVMFSIYNIPCYRIALAKNDITA
jgi:hypothetical protein